jgi:hypothetical protein
VFTQLASFLNRNAIRIQNVASNAMVNGQGVLRFVEVFC